MPSTIFTPMVTLLGIYLNDNPFSDSGALLAIIVLFLFLRNFKSTLIIGLSIPVSIIITLAFIYFRGTSLNLTAMVSMPPQSAGFCTTK